MHQPLPRPVLHVQKVVEEDILSLSTPVPDGADAAMCGTTSCACGSCSDPTSVMDAPGLAETDAVHEVLHDQFLHCIRLGCQDDVNLHALSSHASGVPDWSLEPSAHVCGPSCVAPSLDPDRVPPDKNTSADGTGEDLVTSLFETGEDVLAPLEAGEDGSQATSCEAGEDPSCEAGEDSSDAPLLPPCTTFRLCHLSREQALLLWHQRMGHMSHERVREASKKSIGPPVLPTASDLANCPVCQRAKLHHAH